MMHVMTDTRETPDARLLREAAELEAKLKAAAEAPPDPVLPAGWQPMRTAPRDAVIILHVSNRYFTQMPGVSIGHWDGATWQLMTQVDGDPRKEAVDPDAWRPLPEFRS